MAFHGIQQCYDSATEWFGGVTCSDGAGSSRTGTYANYTDAQMQAVRRQEQNTAADIGRYGVMIQLDYPSRLIKSATDTALRADLREILTAMRPQIVYTHNLADKHETHVGVVIATLQALRDLPPGNRPQKVLGCEMWRDLDWLPDSDKVLLDVSAQEDVAVALNGAFESQIAGGKRYDLATLGRRRANATFLESHVNDRATQLTFAMDLTPLVADETRDIAGYAVEYIEKFKADVQRKLMNRLGS
jgi:LmbE family N-acetylglucosaminyl deacetylase